jgi:hypothetical protein
LLRSAYARVEAEAESERQPPPPTEAPTAGTELDEVVKTLSEGFGAMMRAISDLAASIDTREKPKEKAKARDKS